jgi:hypothetical protein
VCTWEVPLNLTQVTVYKAGSPNISFNIDCWTPYYVYIPDENFKNALKSLGVDTDNDRKISFSEAEAVTHLDVSGKSISDLTGIAAFVNLEVLNCSDNYLTGLDVSNCTLLSELSCSSNPLQYLNISKNTNLFACEDDTCYATLNLSNMPGLYGVCVWEMPFPPVDRVESVDTTGSPNVFFSTDCSITPIEGRYKENRSIAIYPNPADDIMNIEIETIHNAFMEIYDVNGRLILRKAFHAENEKVDVSGFSAGVYLVKITQNGTVSIEKVLVR